MYCRCLCKYWVFLHCWHIMSLPLRRVAHVAGDRRVPCPGRRLESLPGAHDCWPHLVSQRASPGGAPSDGQYVVNVVPRVTGAAVT